ncbi:cytochrome d ubiquinol oxidase subunit II [Corynebacterium halotolerans]|uniref:Cytochrome ubiquinol oxidase subunit n=1 Tax=Corynebacterium halotolerans YIM 70093 = DSM 44683 TaxID=1121362 RepID=M1PB05_9CORY|nr:cytochrome d ubiquinol oxidase subunit II [Corynebacterium halotolerans]AGF73851.1 cytochrome ubiquinol oxidase subunit [Corynebacterium halotolerans YIM 70093 = DSM 44683]
MDLQTLWFIVIAFLFVGYFVLEGFDFGVGMLLPFLGGDGEERARRRDAVATSIGPVWNGNEVWLIVAVGGMFAAFPEWYATMFSGFYLPLLLILLSLILRGVALEWRVKVDTQAWRNRCDIGLAIGSWVPAIFWGVTFTNIVQGVAIDANRQVDSSLTAMFGLFNPYGLLGAVTFVLMFMVHGATFLGIKVHEPLRSQAHRLAQRLTIPTAVVAVGFAVWTQLAHGDPVIGIAVGVLALCVLIGSVSLMRGHDGVAFAATAVAVATLVVQIFATLFPNVMPTSLPGGVSLDIYNASSSDYTLVFLSWGVLILVPFILAAQGWTFWSFAKRITV